MTAGSVGDGRGNHPALADQFGEVLKEFGVGHAWEGDSGDVVGENAASVVSPPPVHHPTEVLKNCDQLNVSRSEGRRVLG